MTETQIAEIREEIEASKSVRREVEKTIEFMNSHYV